MNPQEPDNLIEQPSVVTPTAGVEAEEYVSRELISGRRALKITQFTSIFFVILTVVSIGGITVGFARSLEPEAAATITKGLVSEHVDDQIPEFKRYIKEQTPRLISQLPGYVKKELPVYRTDLENQLESNFDHYADQSSQQLQTNLDNFLTSNQADVKLLMTDNGDPQALARLDISLKKMFVDYLNGTQINGETLQSKIDQSLDGLTQIDSRMKKLAANKNLSDEEKKTRKAIAILLKTVDTNPDIAQARVAVNSVRENAPGQVQAAVQGVLQYTGSDEATFTAPGKAPVTFTLKKPALTPPAGTPPISPPKPVQTAPAKPAPTPPTSGAAKPLPKMIKK